MFTFRQRGAATSVCNQPAADNRLRFETLEPRRLLAVVTVTTAEDVVNFNDGRTSLREAVFATNIVPGPDEIIFDFGHDGPETILLTQGEIEINDSLTIVGDGANLLTIDASGNDPTPGVRGGDGASAFRIDDFDPAHLLDITLQGMRITGADSTRAAIDSRENVTLRSVQLDHNLGGVVDGRYTIAPGTVTIVDTTISENLALAYAIRINQGDLQIVSSSISENEGDGTAVLVTFGSLAMNSSEVRANEGMRGVSASSASISSSAIVGNSSDGFYHNGGFFELEVTHSIIARNGEAGIYLADHNLRDPVGDVTLRNSLIDGNLVNRSTLSGIHIQSAGTVLIEDVAIMNHGGRLGPEADLQTLWGGGGLRVLNAEEVILRRAQFEGNSANSITAGLPQVLGGGLTLHNITQVVIEESEFRDNASAVASGGGDIQADEVLVRNSSFIGNRARYEGGGLRIYGNATIEGSSFTENRALGGGGIYLSGDSVVTGSYFAHNVAVGGEFSFLSSSGHGGGIRANGKAKILNSTITENTAAEGGGGIDFISGVEDGLVLVSSTVDHNSAPAGGGIWLTQGVIEQSTISSNTAEVGGGIFVAGLNNQQFLGETTLRHSTITQNEATMLGGGLSNVGIDSRGSSQVDAYESLIHVDHTIVAGNDDGSGTAHNIAGVVSASYSLIGFGGGTLGPLTTNGGPTRTHEPLPGSPALDAGDPAFQGEGLSDQRGGRFARVFNGRIDIGAVERQSFRRASSGDFDQDGDTDGADFLAWQRGYAADLPATAELASLNGEPLDTEDLQNWQANYGLSSTAPAAPSAAISTAKLEHELVDVAFALGLTLQPKAEALELLAADHSTIQQPLRLAPRPRRELSPTDEAASSFSERVAVRRSALNPSEVDAENSVEISVFAQKKGIRI